MVFRYHVDSPCICDPCFLIKNILQAQRLNKLALDEQIKILSALFDDPQNKTLEEKLSDVSKVLWNTNVTLCPLNPPNLGKAAESTAQYVEQNLRLFGDDPKHLSR